MLKYRIQSFYKIKFVIYRHVDAVCNRIDENKTVKQLVTAQKNVSLEFVVYLRRVVADVVREFYQFSIFGSKRKRERVAVRKKHVLWTCRVERLEVEAYRSLLVNVRIFSVYLYCYVCHIV